LTAPQWLLVDLGRFINVDLQHEAKIVDYIKRFFLWMRVLEEAICQLQHKTLIQFILGSLDVKIFKHKISQLDDPLLLIFFFIDLFVIAKW